MALCFYFFEIRKIQRGIKAQNWDDAFSNQKYGREYTKTIIYHAIEECRARNLDYCVIAAYLYESNKGPAVLSSFKGLFLKSYQFPASCQFTAFPLPCLQLSSK
jgi:hypothetical protein